MKISKLKYHLLCEKSKRSDKFKVNFKQAFDECKENLLSLKKYLAILEAHDISGPVVDSIANCNADESPISTLNERWKEEVSLILDKQYHYASELQYGKSLSRNQNVQILKNMVSMKQCNLKKSMKKCFKLKRCKNYVVI